jgi:single-strand DNA-binding protein
MNETMVTLNGIVVTDLKQAEVRGSTVASFRFLSAVRRYERLRGWHDAELNFVTVTCWRGLALNVIASIKKGDPLIVFGRLRVRPWDSAERGGSTVEIDAYAVGHDLNRGTSAFVRNKEAEAAEKEDTIEETARKVRSDAEEAGQAAEKAILQARRAATVDATSLVIGGAAARPAAKDTAGDAAVAAATPASASGQSAAGGTAEDASAPPEPGPDSDATSARGEPNGEAAAEPEEARRDGKRALFGVRSKDRETASV